MSRHPSISGEIATSGTSTTGISPKHLVNIGVFSAIYIVVIFCGGMIGVAGPWFIFVGYILSILINGTVVMLYVVKTPVFGALTIMALITGGLMVLTGHVWYILPICFVFGLVCDAIVRSGNSRSRWRNILAYGILCIWYVVPMLPIFTNADAYFADMAQQTGEAYADSLRAILQPWVIVTWGGVAFLIGLLSAWLGSKIVIKHFAKAGMVS